LGWCFTAIKIVNLPQMTEGCLLVLPEEVGCLVTEGADWAQK